MSANTKWADIEAEEDLEPDYSLATATGLETKVDEEGIKTVTNYSKNSRGETVKRKTRVKVTTKIIRINKEVYRRANLPKFGIKEDDNVGNTRAPEEYTIEIPKNSYNQLFDDNDFSYMDQDIKTGKDLKSKFKLLKGENEAEIEKQNEPAETTKKYLPPSLRGAMGDRTRDQQQKEEYTVRVTNLSEDVQEDDLDNLFKTAGKISRIYLAINKETGNSKGFAFVTYHRKEDAETAIRKLNRHGYDNLLLNVEWAKPAKDRQFRNLIL